MGHRLLVRKRDRVQELERTRNTMPVGFCVLEIVKNLTKTEGLHRTRFRSRDAAKNLSRWPFSVPHPRPRPRSIPHVVSSSRPGRRRVQTLTLIQSLRISQQQIDYIL